MNVKQSNLTPDLFSLNQDYTLEHLIRESKEIQGDDYSFLRKKHAPEYNSECDDITVVDLFCGAGGISVGVAEAANALGRNISIRWAADFEKTAVDVYKNNFPKANVSRIDLSEIFDNFLDKNSLTETEMELAKKIGRVDILVGGPPCQGHSDLNNYSRRSDPKNSLYFIMARAAQVLKPQYIFIENVVGARHDKGKVVNKTIESLKEQGYSVDVDIVNLVDIGVAQKRIRLVIIASLDEQHSVSEIVENYKVEARDLSWAIGDLENTQSDFLSDQPSTPSANNKKRIDYLFDSNVYDLPDNFRPPCHSGGKHSYKSVYGRLKWDHPSQTITSGFYSMCMGRYVHPSRRRTLTAHEAARLQFFPDYFSFESAKSRTAIAKIIGNAVPPKLSYVFSHFFGLMLNDL